MRITWYGHAAFLIEARGLRIILDPFRSPDSGGYAPILEPADIVVVSHENDRYHSHLGQIIPPFQLVKALDLPLGGEVVAGVRFEAIPVFESPDRLVGDEVSIVHFSMEGIRVAFLGDLGHSLEPDEVALIQGADIALVPAGGPPTLDYPLMADLLDAISPKLVVPMHYLTPRINLKIQPVERFFEVLPDWPIDPIAGSSFQVDAGSLSNERRIVWLQPSR